MEKFQGLTVKTLKIDGGAQCNSQVVVKCSLLNGDAEEAEVLELPSGCVRFLAASVPLFALRQKTAFQEGWMLLCDV